MHCANATCGEFVDPPAVGESPEAVDDGVLPLQAASMTRAAVTMMMTTAAGRSPLRFRQQTDFMLGGLRLGT
jgi:hypothetical protein